MVHVYRFEVVQKRYTCDAEKRWKRTSMQTILAGRRTHSIVSSISHGQGNFNGTLSRASKCLPSSLAWHADEHREERKQKQKDGTRSWTDRRTTVRLHACGSASPRNTKRPCAG